MELCFKCNSILDETNWWPSLRKHGSKICRRCYYNRRNKYRRLHASEINGERREKQKRLRKEILKILGDKCCRCKENDWRCLQIDHVNGNGTREQKSLGTYQYYKKVYTEIKRGSKAYQCLCANCNWRKKYDQGEV